MQHFFLETIPHYIVRFFGIFLVITAIFLLLALLSYLPSDHSINNINDAVVSNIMGHYGAYWADPLLQILGYSYIYPLFVMTVIGIKLARAQSISFIIARTALLVFSIPLISMVFAFVNSSLPYLTSWGGYLGTFMYNEGKLYFNLWTLLLLGICISISSLYIVSTLAISQWQQGFYYIIKIIAVICGFIFWGIKSIYVLCHRIIIKLKDEGDEIPQMPKAEDIVEIAKAKTNTKKTTPTFIQSNLKLDEYAFDKPDISLLKAESYNIKMSKASDISLQQNSKLLNQVLIDFGIKGEIIKIHPGPVVTLYEFLPSPGTKTARIIALSDDIARSMSAISTRISIIQGKSTLGIELPNTSREIIYLHELVNSKQYISNAARLPIILGKNISGNHVIVDLSRMPHLLIAGTTGSGKSVAINTMILSLLYNHTPKECQLILIDPKMLELSVYEGIPHLIAPVVTDPKKAVKALGWAVCEMEDRYRSMSMMGVRNIHGYNKLIEAAIKKGQALTKQVQTGFDKITGEPIFETIELAKEPLPFLVVVVDEMADLMLVAGKEIEKSIQRLAQMARAAGIHLIMATQRPSVDVITGVIKANFPTRVSFQVTSKIDSRTILGEQGAEQLLGMGDMLYMSSSGHMERIHGPFVSDNEVEQVVAHLRKQGKPLYQSSITQIPDEEQDDNNAEFVDPIFNMDNTGDDALYKKAIEIVRRDRRTSTSYIQRSLHIGYNRAANLIEKMERDGILSGINSVGKREILIKEK